MKKSTIFFIIGIYTALCIAVIGYNYINPSVTYDFTKVTKISDTGEFLDFKNFYDIEIDITKLKDNKFILDFKEKVSFKNFKYSVLFSFVGLIVLISFIQLKIRR